MDQFVNSPQTIADSQLVSPDTSVYIERNHLCSLIAETGADSSANPQLDSATLRRQKTIQRLHDEINFKYGEVPKDHPVQAYLYELAQRLPSKLGFPIKLRFLPGLKEIQAFCMPDGTICISSSLLIHAQTEEALLGVIAHEYTHAYREHIDYHNKQVEKVQAVASAKDFLNAILRNFGAQRAQEYEADLRAVIADLNEVGINPLGYEMFLEQLHKLFPGGDIAHGTSLDRALNIKTLKHFVDIRCTDSSLHEIPTHIINGCKELPEGSSISALAYRGNLFGNNDERTIGRNRQRYAALDKLPKEYIYFALQKVFGDTVATIDNPKKHDPANLEILDRLVQMFQTEFLDPLQDLDTAEKQILLPLALELYCGLQVLEDDHEKILPSVKDNYKKQVNTPAALARTRIIASQYIPAIELSYQDKSTAAFFRTLLTDIIERGICGDFASGNINLSELKVLIDSWAESLSSFSARKPTLESISVSALKATALELLSSHTEDAELQQRIRETCQEVLPDPAPINTAQTETISSEFSEIIERHTETLSKVHYNTNLDRILKTIVTDIITHTPDCSTTQLEQFIQDLGDTLFRIQFKRSKKDSRADSYINDKEKALLMISLQPVDLLYTSSYLCTLVLEQIMQRHPAFGTVSKQEKHLKLLTFAYNGLLDDIHDQLKNVLLYTSNEPNEHEKFIIDLTKKVIRKMTKLLKLEESILKHPDADDLRLVYQYLGQSAPESPLREFFTNVLVSFLATKEPLEMVRILDEFMSEGIDLQSFLSKFPTLCGQLVIKVADSMPRNILEKLSVNEIIKISKWISNPFLQSLFQQVSLDLRWSKMSFDEKLGLIFSAEEETGLNLQTLQERFLEEDIRNSTDYQKLKEHANQAIDKLVQQGDKHVGVLALVDRDLLYANYNNMLAALLKINVEKPEYNGTDQPLKKAIYETMVNIHQIDPSADNKLNDIERAILLTEETVRQVFSLNPNNKLILLRKLLASETGVLRKTTTRARFFEILFDYFVIPEQADDDLKDILNKVRQAMAVNAEVDLLYFALSSALSDKIATPPPPSKIIDYHKINEIVDDINGTTQKADRRFDYLHAKTVVDKILWKRVPAEAKAKPWRYQGQFRFPAEAQMQQVLNEMAGTSDYSPTFGMNALEFIKETASKTGSIGVRFLQLLPQIVQLPESRAQAFMDVYDRVKGQAKVSAINLLEREWPELWNEVASIEERIGGGSMVTVYRAIMKDSSVRALKVANPNLKFHLEQTYNFAASILDNLSQKHGPAYESARLALDDIKEWITQDINFQGFCERDKLFKEKYDGFTVKGCRYKIRVPQSFAPDNQFFSSEEYIAGKNITNWQALETDGHDMRQAISLLTKFYVTQVSNGQVLSDVHRGNYALTPQNEIAIYDRNFYLNLNTTEQAVIAFLFNPFISNSAKTDKLTAYLLTTNCTLSKKEETSLQHEVTVFVNCASEQNWVGAQQSIINIKQLGVKIPLTFTLLLKNFNELQLMGRKAGFENLIEMYLY